MAKIQHSIVMILVLGITIKSTWAIQCYSCQGISGAGCYDKFNSANVETVESSSGWCTKVKSSVLGVNTVTRSAAAAEGCTKVQCATASIPGFGDATQCCCNTDRCNSVGHLSSTIALGTILSLFVLTLKKLMF